MKIRAFIIFFVLAFDTLNAQYFEWAKGIGGNDLDVSYSLATDLAGNIYTTGIFQDTADFDPGPGVFNLISQGSFDIFIIKTDELGNFLWAKQIGGVSHDYSLSIKTDQYGNIYFTGKFQETVDFDPGIGTYNLTSFGMYDIFVSKLDSSGNFVWAKQMGGPSGEEGASIILDIYGNIYVTGFFFGTADFDPGIGVFNLIATSSSQNCFVSKLDTLGDFVWAKQVSGDYYVIGEAVTTDVFGNIFITGGFTGTVDFDPSPNIYNLTAYAYILSDIFVLKLDSLGDLIWVKQIGGIYSDVGVSIVTDKSGNVYTGGTFSTTVDFDPDTGVYNLTCYHGDVILKLDASGHFIWAKLINSETSGLSDFSIALDSMNNIYSTGCFTGTVDFNPDSGIFNLSPSTGLGDVFISILDSLGTFKGALQMGGISIDCGLSINADLMGNIYTTGKFQETADFDPEAGIFNLTSAGSSDIFIQKLSQNIITKTVGNNVGNLGVIYPNPTNGQLTINFQETEKNISLRLINMLGEVISAGEYLNTNTAMLNIEGPSGLYFIEIQNSEGKKEVFKVQKNK